MSDALWWTFTGVLLGAGIASLTWYVAFLVYRRRDAASRTRYPNDWDSPEDALYDDYDAHKPGTRHD